MATQQEQFWTEANLAKLTPEFFAHLQTLDAIEILLELKRMGFLDAILRGETPPTGNADMTRAFVAIQVVCRYISQTIRALSSREHALQTALVEANEQICGNHAKFAGLKRDRDAIAMELQRVEEEIQLCDRILKSGNREEEEDEDSPWEDHNNHYEPMVNHHLRSTAAVSSMLMASPMNINHAFNNSFFHHSQQDAASSMASPKFGATATPRSRAGSETSTQGGMMSEDELVLFRTIGTSGGSAWEKVTSAAQHIRQKPSSRMENRINEVAIEEEEEEK